MSLLSYHLAIVVGHYNTHNDITYNDLTYKKLISLKKGDITYNEITYNTYKCNFKTNFTFKT